MARWSPARPGASGARVQGRGSGAGGPCPRRKVPGQRPIANPNSRCAAANSWVGPRVLCRGMAAARAGYPSEVRRLRPRASKTTRGSPARQPTGNLLDDVLEADQAQGSGARPDQGRRWPLAAAARRVARYAGLELSRGRRWLSRQTEGTRAPGFELMEYPPRACSSTHRAGGGARAPAGNQLGLAAEHPARPWTRHHTRSTDRPRSSSPLRAMARHGPVLPRARGDSRPRREPWPGPRASERCPACARPASQSSHGQVPAGRGLATRYRRAFCRPAVGSAAEQVLGETREER